MLLVRVARFLFYSWPLGAQVPALSLFVVVRAHPDDQNVAMSECLQRVLSSQHGDRHARPQIPSFTVVPAAAATPSATSRCCFRCIGASAGGGNMLKAAVRVTFWAGGWQWE